MDTYEKKYKEALELARVAAFNGHQSLMEGIFPELRESDDEKVREDIISLVNEFWERIGSINPEYSSRSRMLAWLEKQGESSDKIHYWTEEEIEPIISDYLRGAEHYGGMIGRLRCLKPKSLEKQGEISPILSNSSNIGKNAWSEEDEEHYKACLQYFDAVNPDMVYYKDYQWLKSLKQKIGGKQ